jgi:RNA polymerase sigma-70 factor (ECF subfamily)
MTYISKIAQNESRNRHGESPRGRNRRDNFREELLEHLPHLRNYALSLTQDHTEASDLVQDCLLKALEKRHQYQKDTHMRRWLFTILRNHYLDQWRQRTRRGTHMPVEDCSQASLSHPASQDDWMDLRSCQRELRKLGAYDRAILLLSVFSPMSHKEIAAALDVAEGTIRSRLSRARSQLKAV